MSHASQSVNRSLARAGTTWAVLLLALCLPDIALAGGPFQQAATQAQTNLLTILTPIAVIAVMALGVAAWFNKIAWGWAVAGVIGIVLVFGAPQIVAWVRTMAGV
jgi:type IV secretion system protein VirB2